MCDQGKKDRANRNGTTRNGPAPASRECHYLPVDCQNLKCYNGSASQATHDGQSQKGVGKCDGVSNLQDRRLLELVHNAKGQGEAIAIAVRVILEILKPPQSCLTQVPVGFLERHETI